MNKIIPFKKEIEFNTKISEITSISLEHNINNISNDLSKNIEKVEVDTGEVIAPVVQEEITEKNEEKVLSKELDGYEEYK